MYKPRAATDDQSESDPLATRRSPPGAVLQISGLTLAYGQRQILNQVELDLGAGDSVAVMGRSGSGKTSLLSCILGMVKPDEGLIRVGGVQVKPGSSRRISRLRREKIGIVFQADELLPELAPIENVMISGLLAGHSVRHARERCYQLFEELEIPAGARSTSELSGGERQRVAVARALMNRPALLLADEPTGSLDPETRDQVIRTLFRVPARHDCALIVVTHDPVVAAPASRRLWLAGGQLSPCPPDVRGTEPAEEGARRC